MGTINIRISGSFLEPAAGTDRTRGIDISAERGGHAYAISRAIKYLNDQMGKAIQIDHKLHDAGTRPPESDFGYSSR